MKEKMAHFEFSLRFPIESGGDGRVVLCLDYGESMVNCYGHLAESEDKLAVN